MKRYLQSHDGDRRFRRSRQHQDRAHRVIPGAAHTYAKGDDQFPAGLCPVITRGKGCHVWDKDGNRFIEYGGGVRSVTLGHGFAPVCEAAYRVSLAGTNFARPAVIELSAAEKMLQLIRPAEMVKFAKNGSDAVTAAIKIARAYTGRDLIAYCADHPFFSIHDWFIGTTPMDSGIPASARDLAVPFRYNDIASVAEQFAQEPGRIACVVLEPEASIPHDGQFLHQLRALCDRNGALLILDETITGFRWHIGGGQTHFGVTPDLSTFGKAMANGFAVSALCGKREFMRLAGIEHTDRERCFAMSLTHGADASALAAFIRTAQVYQKRDIVGTLHRQGKRLADGVRAAIQSIGLGDYFTLSGRDCLLLYGTLDQNRQRSQAFRTLFLQELLKRGVLAPNFAVSAAHGDAEIDCTILAVAQALQVYAAALSDGIEKYLIGRPVQPVFRKYNQPESARPPANSRIVA
jgi:glutamate-1-semialdehyde 2,1-aminomutase